MNPVYEIFDKNKPFTYFHTHVITNDVLDAALAAHKSLEIDISVAEDGTFFIGHPLSFYEFKREPLPNNLSLETVLGKVKTSDLFVVLDCKDVRALPKVEEIILDLGAGRCLVHAWADALLFKPYPKEIQLEPHWQFEDLPMSEILKIKQATNVPVALSTRGLTLGRLEEEHGTITRLIEVAKGKVEAVNLHLPKGELPPKPIMQKLLDNRILTLINLDRVPDAARPGVFLGWTDHLEQASNPQNF